MKDKVVISCSIPKDVAVWLDRRADEWRVSRSWLISNLLFSAMVHSGVLPDADKKDDQQHKL